MKVALIALLCLTAVLANYEHDEGVVVLTDSNFGEALNEFEYALVEFYAPWCGHCKTLAPEYARAAQELAQTHPHIKICKLDATAHTSAAGKYEVRGFPTLKLFIKGNAEPIAYEAGRTAGDIVNWLKKKTGPASVQAHNVEEAEKLVADNQVLGFFFGPSTSDAYTRFLSVAQSFDDVAFAHTHDENVLNHYGVSNEGFILFKKFDEGKNVYSGDIESQNLREFINNNRFPTVLPFDQKVAQRIFGEGLDAIFLVRGNDEKSQEAEKAFVQAAEKLKGKIAISLANIEDSLGGRLAEYIGVSRDSLPAIRIVQPGQGMKKFNFENEITAENLEAFVNSFKSGELTPYFKSEAIPADPFDDNVRVVVGKNFQEVVLDPNTDVLIEFYAPWCGHCKTLAPIFSAVGKKLRDVEGVVIAKMDATANEAPGVNVQGFPTIKYYKRGQKENPQDYNGDRSEKGFIDFLRQESSARIPPTEIDL